MKALDLFINNKCNFSCSYCTVDNSINKNYNFEDIKKINFKEFDTINILGGEPTLHPDFINIINYIYNQNKNIVIFTNGTMINKLKAIDNLNIKFIITLHYNLKNSLSFYKNLYFDILKKLKSKTDIYIILHKDNEILFNFFNSILKKSKKDKKNKKDIFLIINYFDEIENKVSALNINKIKRKYPNFNYSRIYKSLSKNQDDFLSELWVWENNKFYKDNCEKCICTIKDHFLKESSE